MIDTLKSEFRKLITLRSTYIITGLVLLFVIFMTFYIVGIRTSAGITKNPAFLAEQVVQAVSAMGLLIALVGLLLWSHEYRHNLITYTLTASRSRTQVLLAKVIVVSGFAIGMSLVIAVLAPVMAYIGAVVVKGAVAVPQEFELWSLFWRVIATGWGYAMFGLIFAALIRNQVGAIAGYLFTPVTVEPLLGLLLKENIIYLPYNTIAQVILGADAMSLPNSLPYAKAALIMLLYIIVGWIIAWLLFMRRDAN